MFIGHFLHPHRHYTFELLFIRRGYTVISFKVGGGKATRDRITVVIEKSMGTK